MLSTSPSSIFPQPTRRRPDVRGRALIITALATVLVGAALAWSPQNLVLPRVPDVRFDQVLEQRGRQQGAREQELRTRFEQGVMMLHMRQYDYALTAFHRVLAFAPRMPEAHVNMGFALLGLEQWEVARSFFESAIELRRDQMNAYYGLAVSLEALDDLPGALGAMQAYIHRASPDDPFRARAEAALWEWREAASKAADTGSDAAPR